MTRRDQESLTRVIGVTLVMLAVALAFVLWVGPVAGDDNDDQLALARAAVAECGWVNPRCHAALWHALDLRAETRRRSIGETVRDYCAAWDSRTDSERSRWVRNLPKVEVRDGVGSTGDAHGDVGDGVFRRGAVWASKRDDAVFDGATRVGSDARVGPAPAGWPAHASWPRHLRLWRRVYARAGAYLRGEVKNPCNGRPWHTGADYGVDHRRAVRAGWVRLECGDTGRQAFYGRARR